MKIKSATFAGSSTSPDKRPARSLPEFAFIGRSNVGKSSLINMLCEFHPDRCVFWHEYFFKYLFYLMLFLLWVLWNESPRLHPRK